MANDSPIKVGDIVRVSDDWIAELIKREVTNIDSLRQMRGQVTRIGSNIHLKHLSGAHYIHCKDGSRLDTRSWGYDILVKATPKFIIQEDEI
jgi:hypothetical protein